MSNSEQEIFNACKLGDHEGHTKRIAEAQAMVAELNPAKLQAISFIAIERGPDGDVICEIGGDSRDRKMMLAAFLEALTKISKFEKDLPKDYFTKRTED